MLLMHYVPLTDMKEVCDNKIAELEMKVLTLEAKEKYQLNLFLSFTEQLHSISSGIQLCTITYEHIRYVVWTTYISLSNNSTPKGRYLRMYVHTDVHMQIYVRTYIGISTYWLTQGILPLYYSSLYSRHALLTLYFVKHTSKQ